MIPFLTACHTMCLLIAGASSEACFAFNEMSFFMNERVSYISEDSFVKLIDLRPVNRSISAIDTGARGLEDVTDLGKV